MFELRFPHFSTPLKEYTSSANLLNIFVTLRTDRLFSGMITVPLFPAKSTNFWYVERARSILGSSGAQIQATCSSPGNGNGSANGLFKSRLLAVNNECFNDIGPTPRLPSVIKTTCNINKCKIQHYSQLNYELYNLTGYVVSPFF